MPTTKKERQSAKERIQRTEAYADKVRQQFAGAVNDILALNKRLPELPEGQMYSFDGAGKKVQREVDNILRELHSATVATVRTGITQEWAEANKAVDEILASALGRKALSNPNLAGWFDRNEKAMDAFLKRTQDGFNLSRRIWNTTTQLREEMEVAMTVAIGEGESASAMSRRVRQYLDDPDLMFRRFRYKDDEGNWQRKWKKKVVDSDGKYHFIDYDRDSYKVGAGQYKSAYKNAMRVTRTETNIAYRRADHERWQQLDLVLGQRIQTSNSHPKEDICDELAGDYPKDFVFDGWHPQCFCICTPIMADEEEMKKEMEAVLAGEDYEPNYEPITTYPEGFQKFLDENREKIEQAQKAGTAPYFIENNEAVVQRRFEGEDLTQMQTEEPSMNDSKENTGEVIDYNKQNDTIEDYISGERMWINQYLRGDEEVGELSSEEQKYLDELTSLTETEMVEDKVLYRSINADAVFGRMSDSQYDDLKNKLFYDSDPYKDNASRVENILDSVGNVVKEDGFMSTTRDKDVAQEWGDYTGADHPVVLRIETNNNTTGLDVEKYTRIHNPQAEENDPQREVLLSRGQEYRITRIYADDGNIMVDVRLLDNGNQSNEKGNVTGALLDELTSLRASGIEYNNVERLEKELTNEEIIKRVWGEDLTAGSCVSTAFAYIGNKHGYDVLDFRGGESCDYFSKSKNAFGIMQKMGGLVESSTDAIEQAKKHLATMQEGKEYLLFAGRHASIVRIKEGKYQYCELQTSYGGYGFKTIWGDYAYEDRFHCRSSQKTKYKGGIIDIDAFANDDTFAEMLGYINTAKDKRVQGAGGGAK